MFKAKDDIIESFLQDFYDKVRKDEVLGPVFNTVIDNWDKHLRKIAIFWRSHLKEPGLYKGNPLEVHKRLHEKDSFSKEQFQRWLQLFEDVAEKYFEDKDLKSIKMKARMIGGTLYGRLLDEDLEVPGYSAFNV